MEPLRPNRLSLGNKLGRAVWQVVWLVLYRPSPIPVHGWRRLLLRIFGATIDTEVRIYPSARVWAPWNLTMRRGSCLGPLVDCYCVDRVVLGIAATVSQYSYLCTASHDYTRHHMPLITGPIVVSDYAWVTADVFVGPGVTIGEGAVVLARSTVTRDVRPWMVAGGPVAKEIKPRVFVDTDDSHSPIRGS